MRDDARIPPTKAGVAQLVERQLPKQKDCEGSCLISGDCDSEVSGYSNFDSSPVQGGNSDDETPPDLSRLAALWPSLPESVRNSILTLAEASAKPAKD